MRLARAAAIAALATASLGVNAEEPKEAKPTAEATPAAAQGEKPTTQPRGGAWASADENKDGKVTYEEVKKQLPSFPEDRFQLLDKNKDGSLTTDELPGAGRRSPVEMLGEADADGDTKITRDEVMKKMPDKAEDIMKSFDRNNDGVIDNRDTVNPGGGKGGGGLLRRGDKDNDGKVSAEEYKAAVPNATDDQFANLDKDKDGVLTPKDFPVPPKPQGEAANQGRPGIRMADANKDGAVSKDEFEKAFPNANKDRFATLDRNDSGSIEGDELPREQAAQQRGASDEWTKILATLIKDNDGDADGDVTLSEMQKKKPGFTQPAFNRFDTNGDGVITKADPPQKGTARPGRRDPMDAVRERMRNADKDGDGKVSIEEAQKAFNKMDEEGFKKRDRNGDGFISEEDTKPGAAPAVKAAPAAEKKEEAKVEKKAE